MPCDPLLIWRPIPVGSTFKATASGDENKFNVLIAVTLNSQSVPPLRHDDIVPGPGEIPIQEGDRYVLDIAISVFSTPDDPITFAMSVVDESGDVVSIDGIPLQCDTTMAAAGSQTIKVIASAV